MADYAHELVVVHEVHESGKDADAAVRACECIDVDHIVNLEIQGDAVGFGNAFGKFAQTDCVGVVFGKYRIVLVHPVDRFPDVLGHLSVGECGGFHSLGSTAYGFAEIELCRSREGNGNEKC